MNTLLKKILFCLPEEEAHSFALCSLNLAYRFGLLRFRSHTHHPKKVMGLNFPNPVGLAAGFDKNADYVDALAALHFGFIEIGTVTPKPQKGNAKPRLFRMTKEEAIINRMGFNNKGVDYVLERLKKMKYRGILGINIGKNRDTPIDQAVEDYLFSFRKLWPFASYMTINISSPNTLGLRDLQQPEWLEPLLLALKNEQAVISKQQNKYVPLAVKLSPDLSKDELINIAALLLKHKVDGVIATNTTLQRQGVEHSPFANEEGGLSGRPLNELSTNLLTELHRLLQNKIPIIASGGVMDEKSAQEKIRAGASLVQIYSGLIFSGPRLIKRLVLADKRN